MSDDTPSVALDETECWDLLRNQEFGRLAYHLGGEVHIVPINYATDGERIYFRTAEGSKLLGVVMNADVAFEIDEITGEAATSVCINGTAAVLPESRHEVVESLPLRPWVPSLKFNVVAITPVDMTGRRFSLNRPWRRITTPSSNPRPLSPGE